MSLTGKLILGFLFAAVLQVVQLLVSAHYTRQMMSASVQVSDALAADLAVQAGLDAVRALRERITSDQAAGKPADPAVLAVFVEEAGEQVAALRPFFAGEQVTTAQALQSAQATLQQQLRDVQGSQGEAGKDAIAFLDDAGHDLGEALQQAQTRVRAIAAHGVERERAVHDLPERAGIALMASGLVLMAAFVAWFSRQLVVPIQRAWAELERRVAKRTAELASTVQQLEGTIAERERVQAQKEELNRRLVEASWQAGMAELANGVLHNVGNVLNSVNVSVDLLREQLRTSKVAGLARTVELLERHRDGLGTFLDGSEQGRKVAPYLGMLAAHLQQERDTLLEESLELAEGVNLMKAIVGRQQSYARVAGVTEPLQLTAIADDVVRLHATACAANDIRRVVECDGEDQVEADRARVMQILMNLVTNARHAVQQKGSGGGTVRIVIAHADPDRVQVRVVDDGIGIPAENLARIFGHGFTTKSDGHGFGLHHSANAATEMGGRLWAESDGPGHGATFCLELPVRSAAAKAVADSAGATA